jgi:hypothetical protein
LQIFYWWVKLKRKINLTNRQKNNQKNKDEIQKNNTSQIGIEGWNWKQIEFLQKKTKIRNQKNKDWSLNLNK